MQGILLSRRTIWYFITYTGVYYDCDSDDTTKSRPWPSTLAIIERRRSGCAVCCTQGRRFRCEETLQLLAVAVPKAVCNLYVSYRYTLDTHIVHFRYWEFLLYLFIGLVACELILSPLPWFYSAYSATIGYVGLGVEATLPLPQILANHRSRSCKGFRFSVLVSWIAGDIMKMFWFFTATSAIPWAFKLCGIFQMCCDLFLGVQYWMYGEGNALNGRRTPIGEKDVRLS